MPKSLRTYLDELRRKKTPGHDPENLYDQMYQSLSDLDETLNDEELGEEQKYSRVSELYERTRQLVLDYNQKRSRSFFGPSDWERSTGLLGQLYTDLTNQLSIFTSMRDADQAPKQRFQTVSQNYEYTLADRPGAEEMPGANMQHREPLSELNLIDLENQPRNPGRKAPGNKAQEAFLPDDSLNNSSMDLAEAFGFDKGPEEKKAPVNEPVQDRQQRNNGPAPGRRAKKFENVLRNVTVNELKEFFDDYGPTFDGNNYIPSDLRKVLGNGSISTGRTAFPQRSEVSYRSWQETYFNSLVDLSAFDEPAPQQEKTGDNREKDGEKKALAKNKFELFAADFIRKDFILRETILSADLSLITDEERENYINGEQPAGEKSILSNEDLRLYLNGLNPFRNAPEDAKKFRSAVLDCLISLNLSKDYINAMATTEGDSYFNYVDHHMVRSHGYFAEPAGADRQTSDALAEKRKKLQTALTALAQQTYNDEDLIHFTDESPEARSQFAFNVVKPANAQYNSIESSQKFQELVAKANPFANDLDPDSVINETEAEKEARLRQAEQDTIVFRAAVFDMVTARKRARLDAVYRERKALHPSEDLVGNAAAATRLANSLGFGAQIEQVTRLNSLGPTEKAIYFKAHAEGIAPGSRNINDPDLFAADGAVLDSGSLAAKLSDIQVFRFLTGNTDKGLRGLRFTMSKDDPPRITGVMDTDNDYAFSCRPDDPNASLDPDNIPAMRRSTANRILAMTPELLKASIGGGISGTAVTQAVTRLTRLQDAIRKGLDQKWPEKDALIAGRIHVMDDADLESLSVKQLAAVQGNAKNGLFSSVYSGVVLKGEAAAKENSSYPGGLYQKGMADLMETQAGKDSSPSFTRAMEGVKKLNRELVRYMKEDRPLTAEELPKLRKLYSECLGDVSQYVTGTRGWRWTTRGDRRHNGMETMQNFMRKELEALYNYDPSKNWKLERIIDHARQEEVVLPDDKQEKLGGNLNSREVMGLNGRKGVFTARHSWDSSMETLRERYLKDIDADHFPDPQMRSAMQAAAEVLFDKRESVVRPFMLDAYLLDSFTTKFGSAEENFMNRAKVSGAVNALNDAFRGKNIPEIGRSQGDFAAEFRKNLADLLEKCSLLENERSLYETAGIRHGANIDQRNTAMSVTADLLENPGIIARAHDVRILQNGQIREGTFMEWAEGTVAGNNAENTKSDFTHPKANLMTRDALQQLADLQVADFISGNTDRHLNNAMFKLVPQKNGELHMKKVTGIDNDLSGGNIRMKDRDDLRHLEKRGQLVFPDNMLMMRQSTANAVLNLTKDTVQAAYRPYLKGNGEIDALWERVKAVQDQLRKDANYRWKSDHSLAVGHIRVLADDDPIWDSFRPGGLQHTASIFTKYDKMAARAEYMKAFRPDRQEAVDHYLRKRLANDHPYADIMPRLDYHVMPEVTKLSYLKDVINNKKPGESAEDYAEFYRNLGTGNFLDNTRFMGKCNTLADKLRNDLMTLGYNNEVKNFFQNNGLRAAGFKDMSDLFYIDGRPYNEYARDHFPDLVNHDLYKGAKGSTLIENMDVGVIMALLTSGRHHVDLVIPGMDKEGRMCADITELTMDLERLKGTEGRFGTSRISRHTKLLNDGTREARFRRIEDEVKNRMIGGAAKLRNHFKLKEDMRHPGYPEFQSLKRPAEEFKDLLKEPLAFKDIEKEFRDTGKQAGSEKKPVRAVQSLIPGNGMKDRVDPLQDTNSVGMQQKKRK